MSEIILYGETQRDHALKLISELDLSKPWRIVVKMFVKSRSNPQLALYFKWMGIISKETGNDQDDLHEFFKQKFLDPEIKEVMGEQIAIFSTHGTAKRMTEYMEKVFAFTTSTLGIFLPLPQDQGLQTCSKLSLQDASPKMLTYEPRKAVTPS